MLIKNMTNRVSDFLLALLTSFSFVYALTTSLGFTYPVFSILLLIAVFLIFCLIAFFNKLSIRITAVLTAAAIIALVLYIILKIGLTHCMDFLNDYFYWLSDFINGTGSNVPLYQIITVVALCAAISVFVHFFTVKKFIFLIPLVTGVVIFVVQWSYGYMVSYVPFYMFLFTILPYYFKHILAGKSLRNTNEYLKSSVFLLWTIPVCALVILIAFSMHASNKPMEWKWLDQKVNSIYNYFNKRLDYDVFDYFSVASSGFGEKNNNLGGRVRLDKTLALMVKTPRNIYLKGAVKDTYTGSKWVNSSVESLILGNNYSSLYSDTDEMLTGMQLLTDDPEYKDKYFFKDDVSVTFQYLRTKSIFLPSKVSLFSPVMPDANSVLDANGVLSLSKRMGTNYKYSMQIFSPKLGTQEFTDLMRKSRNGLYESYLTKNTGLLLAGNKSESIQNSLNPVSVTDLKILDYYTNSKNIYSKYLQVPDTLPQRVRDLAKSITAPYNNNYDKVKAIEKYLSTNFPYSLEVKSTPKGRDFVDYFLFDLKKGYCSYYASALTVLSRCAGIPARFAEGYILPPKPTKDSPTTYLITNEQAHAWVEVYFEGYGWLPFEPTSPFRANFYSDTSITSAVSNLSDTGQSYLDYMQMLQRYNRFNSDESLDIQGTEKAKTPALLVLSIVFGGLSVLFVAVLLFSLFKSKIRLFKMMNLPPRDSVLQLYNHYMLTLSLQDLGIEAGETPFQYSKRIDTYLVFSPLRFRTVTDIFVKSRYSMLEISEKEKQALCDFHSSLMNQTKINMNRFKYFLYKNIFGKI